MSNIYFAAPLFNDAERQFNDQLAHILETNGYKVFLPQRDGNESFAERDITEEERALRIFSADISAIQRSDILFMVLDGRVPDEGACVELGFAYCSGKRCYGIRTDVRAAERGLALNPMLTGCFRHIIYCNGAPATQMLEEYLSKNKL